MAETPSRRTAACAPTPGTTPTKVRAPACAQATSNAVGSGIRHPAKSASASSAANVPSPPSSSEATACTTTSPRAPPAAATAAAACIAAATAAVMSADPRPCSRPSRTAPDQGSSVQASVPGSTTSRWPLRHSRGRAGLAPRRDGAHPDELVARRLLARVARVRAQRGKVVLDQAGPRAHGPRPAARSAPSAPRSSPVTLGTAPARPRRRSAPQGPGRRVRAPRPVDRPRRLPAPARVDAQRAATRGEARAQHRSSPGRSARRGEAGAARRRATRTAPRAGAASRAPPAGGRCGARPPRCAASSGARPRPRAWSPPAPAPSARRPRGKASSVRARRRSPRCTRPGALPVGGQRVDVGGQQRQDGAGADEQRQLVQRRRDGDRARPGQQRGRAAAAATRRPPCCAERHRSTQRAGRQVERPLRGARAPARARRAGVAEQVLVVAARWPAGRPGSASARSRISGRPVRS